jgi:uncharacterized protein
MACAAFKGAPEMVKLLHELGSELACRDKNGFIPMHQAAKFGHTAVVKDFVSKGVDVNTETKGKHTALHFACMFNRTATVRALLQLGADCSIKNDQGMNCLFGAMHSGNTDIVNAVLQKESDVNTTAYNGLTLLTQAAKDGHTAVAELLISKGVDVNAMDFRGSTALHEAAEHDNLEMVQLLLANGATVHIVQQLGNETPLLIAVREGYVEITKALIAAGADVLHVRPNGYSCLHAAMMFQDTCVPLLLEKGAALLVNRESDAQRCDCCGSCSPLMLCKHAQTVKLLLAAGGDVHRTTTVFGNTCLHVAAAHDYPAPVICLLIKAGADLHAVNNAGKTAAQVAEAKGHQLAVALLSRAAR